MKQKHENITLSIPADLNAMLHSKFPHRGISSYVAKVVRESLQNEELCRLRSLECAYEEAEKDSNRQEVIAEWAAVDNDDDERWDW